MEKVNENENPINIRVQHKEKKKKFNLLKWQYILTPVIILLFLCVPTNC